MTDDGRLDNTDLDNIEAAAKGYANGVPRPFAHPKDTVLLVAEVRRLRALERQIIDHFGPKFTDGAEEAR